MLRVAASTQPDTATALAEITEQLDGVGAGLVLVFHSPQHDGRQVAAHLRQAFPGATTAGCTSCGEIGPQGLTDGGISAFALPGARAAGQIIEDGAAFVFRQSQKLLDDLAQGIGRARRELSSDRHVVLSFCDGLSMAEESVAASLSLAAPELPMVGGSAADDMELVQTSVFLDGEHHAAASLVLLLEPGVAFRHFAIHHFVATERRVVVTASDARRLRSLDGWPACHVYAELAEVSRDELVAEPMLPSALDVVFGIRAGGELFLRSPMKADGEELLMHGPVYEGDVLRVMRGDRLVEVTAEAFAAELDTFRQQGEDPAGLLLFNCGGRLQEAKRRDLVGDLAAAMSPVPAAGFSTYGEQFGPLLVNHTVTGVLFGSGDVGSA